MTDPQPPEDPLAEELRKYLPPPEGVIPEGTGLIEYSYVEDGERIHGVANGSRIYRKEQNND